MRAEEIRIESDEDGFHLLIQIVDGEDDPELDFLLGQDTAEDLHEAARTVIGPWLSEMRAVQSERAVAIREGGGLRVEPDEEPYEITDPKHPRHHEVMADYADLD